jgi:hypothetical protein
VEKTMKNSEFDFADMTRRVSSVSKEEFSSREIEWKKQREGCENTGLRGTA